MIRPGGRVCFDDGELVDRAFLLRRWGRRSEVQFGPLPAARCPIEILINNAATARYAPDDEFARE